MAKLDVVAQAGEGQARANGISGAMAEVSVTRASDGGPVTGIPSDAFDVWVSYSAQAGYGFRPGSLVIQEKSAIGMGPEGVYEMIFNGNVDQGAPWSSTQTVFVEIVVRSRGDAGQTIAAFHLPT